MGGASARHAWAAARARPRTATGTTYELIRLGAAEDEPCPLPRLRVHLRLNLVRGPASGSRRGHRQDDEHQLRHTFRYHRTSPA
jgi:hypothetical protein